MNITDLRRSIYLLLTTVAVAIAVAKVVGAENVFEPSRYAAPASGGFNSDRIDAPTRPWPVTRPDPNPMFGSNDKSRWATIRALVDHGTFQIGHRTQYDDPRTDSGIIFEEGWKSIDKVMDPKTGKYYSSKPPLFSVILAGEYLLLKTCFGWDIDKHPWMVICTILLTVNVLPFAISLVLMANLIEVHGTTDFGKLFAFISLSFGTFWLTFSNTLNNHTPAMACVVFTLYTLLRTTETHTRVSHFLSGFFAALTVTFEMPAACFTVSILAFNVYKTKLRSIWMIFGMIIPIVAFFAANYAALNRFLPAYSDFGGPWYNYPGSHWARFKPGVHVPGIDFAQESRSVYLFHCLVGHHGWFSLTPVWLIGLIGIFATCRIAVKKMKSDAFSYPLIVQLAWLLTLVLVLFFVYIRPTNNYGGGTSGLRWFFWLTPFWIFATLAGADILANVKWARILMGLLLGVSVLSVFYPAWNPWRSPWLMVLMERLEWVNYERRQ